MYPLPRVLNVDPSRTCAWEKFMRRNSNNTDEAIPHGYRILIPAPPVPRHASCQLGCHLSRSVQRGEVVTYVDTKMRSHRTGVRNLCPVAHVSSATCSSLPGSRGCVLHFLLSHLNSHIRTHVTTSISSLGLQSLKYLLSGAVRLPKHLHLFVKHV